MDFEQIMADAQNAGLESAKQIGMMVSDAWNAIEEHDYAKASTLYTIIARMTSHLANQTFAMATAEYTNKGDSA